MMMMMIILGIRRAQCPATCLSLSSVFFVLNPLSTHLPPFPAAFSIEPAIELLFGSLYFPWQVGIEGG